MRVPRGDSKPMIYHYQAAVACVVVGNVDDAVGGGVNRRAVVRRHVHSGMERTLTAERIQAFAKTVRDVALNWPN